MLANSLFPTSIKSLLVIPFALSIFSDLNLGEKGSKHSLVWCLICSWPCGSFHAQCQPWGTMWSMLLAICPYFSISSLISQYPSLYPDHCFLQIAALFLSERWRLGWRWYLLVMEAFLLCVLNKLGSDELRLKADILRSRPQTEVTCKTQTSLLGTLTTFRKKLLLAEKRAAQSSTSFYSRASVVLSSLLSLPDSDPHAWENSSNCCSVLLILILYWMAVRS